MIISPNLLLPLIRKGEIVTRLSDRELLNPEGVGFDLRVGSVSRVVRGHGSLKIDTRRTPGSELVSQDKEGCFELMVGNTYLVSTIEEFNLPQHLAATFFPRSTLFRSGVDFQSSVLPPGYVGPMTFSLFNRYEKSFWIQYGARFAHAVFHQVGGESGLYKGQWQGGRISVEKDERQI